MSDRVLHTPGLKALLSDLATAAKTPRAHHVMMKSEGDQVAHTWAEGAAVGGGNRRVVPPDAVGKHHAPRRPRVRILRPQLRLCMSIEHFQKSVCMRLDPLTGASAASVQRATAVVRPCPHRMHLILIASRVASSLQAALASRQPRCRAQGMERTWLGERQHDGARVRGRHGLTDIAAEAHGGNAVRDADQHTGLDLLHGCRQVRARRALVAVRQGMIRQ